MSVPISVMKDVEIFDPRTNDCVALNGNAQFLSAAQRIIVIGSGPVGIRVVQEVLKRKPFASVLLFGNEPFQPYNRVQLSSLLAGEIDRDDIDLPLPNSSLYPHFNYVISTVKRVDIENKSLVDASGESYRFDQLVFATGARAHVPNIQGVEQTGVYTFRNLKDTEFLYARVTRARHVVVVGGGLLGLEAARALSRLNTQVTLVQQASRLMNRQLDEPSSELLQKQVEALGIKVITCSGVRQIHSSGEVIEGRSSVSGVTIHSGEDIACDTVVLCAGIKPNIELARDAKLKVARGIVVDDQLTTSHKDIYAIGECCEHQGTTYGLVNPGLEQAAVAANALTGGNAKYLGSLSVSRLKVVGQSVCSMGSVTELQRSPFLTEVVYQNHELSLYRKVVFLKGKVLGVVAYGDWPEFTRIQEIYKQGRTIYPWQLITFRLTGHFWWKDPSKDVSAWPEETVICQCNNITHGSLVDALENGCRSQEQLSEATGAATVCGSCKPLLDQLVEHHHGETQQRGKESGWLPLLVGSFLAVCIVFLLVFQPEAQVSNSVIQKPWFESVWNDGYWKQVSGFSLLGLSVLGLLMSLKKRAGWHWMGKFSHWRMFHTLLGVGCVATLILHTGFHLGVNLNQALMINFLIIIVLGAMTGLVVALSHKLTASHAMTLRKFWTWGHVLVSWPLPVLLAAHVVSVYYF